MSSSILSSTINAVHSAFVTLTSGFTSIEQGSPLPDTVLKEDDPTKAEVNLAAQQGKILIIGVPAAFSPPCSSQIPGYIEHFSKFQDKGISAIYVVAVNDVFVTKAWKAKLAGENQTLVHFLADDKAAFSSELGLVYDATSLVGGPRAKRFVIVAENGIATKVVVESDPTTVDLTEAMNILKSL